jgi:multiple sugar transport system permease protein
MRHETELRVPVAALRWRKHVPALISQILLALVAVLFMFPLIWMVDTAIKPNDQVFQTPPSLIPWGHAEWENFWNAYTYLPFGRYALTTLIVAVFGTVLVTATSSMAGYAFARLKFRGREGLFILYLSTLMVPQAILVVPLFIFMNHIGWTDSYQALILPPAFTAFGTFLMRQYFRSLPVELDEAALIDGCSRWRTFLAILLPMAQPALSVLALFTFIGFWNNFLWPLVVTTTLTTMPLGLQQFQGIHVSYFNQQMAGCMISMLPGIVLVIAMQRYLVDGISITGMAGR